MGRSEVVHIRDLRADYGYFPDASIGPLVKGLRKECKVGELCYTHDYAPIYAPPDWASDYLDYFVDDQRKVILDDGGDLCIFIVNKAHSMSTRDARRYSSFVVVNVAALRVCSYTPKNGSFCHAHGRNFFDCQRIGGITYYYRIAQWWGNLFVEAMEGK